MTRRNILHVVSTLDPSSGGPPVAMLGLGQAQAKAGLDISVLATYREGEDRRLADELQAGGVTVERVGPCRGALGLAPGLSRRVHAAVQRADVVHIHALWEQIQHDAARAAEKLGRPYVITPHGMLDPWCLRQSRWKKAAYMIWRLRRNLNRASAIHFTADVERDLCDRLRLKPPAIIEPNGVRLDEFHQLPEAGAFRQQWPAIGDRPIVLFMSRLHHKKGLHLLIPAFAQAALPDACLVIAGPGEPDYTQQIRQLVTQHKLDDRVVFTGMLHGPERIAALVDANLFVLSSFQENFGIAIVEALAAGTPVAISDQVNIERDIREAQVGAVFPLEVPAIAEALRTWMSDAERLAAAAERARPFVWRQYDWQRIAERWVDHYARLCDDTADGRASA